LTVQVAYANNDYAVAYSDWRTFKGLLHQIPKKLSRLHSVKRNFRSWKDDNFFQDFQGRVATRAYMTWSPLNHTMKMLQINVVICNTATTRSNCNKREGMILEKSKDLQAIIDLFKNQYWHLYIWQIDNRDTNCALSFPKRIGEVHRDIPASSGWAASAGFKNP